MVTDCDQFQVTIAISRNCAVCFCCGLATCYSLSTSSHGWYNQSTVGKRAEMLQVASSLMYWYSCAIWKLRCV